MLFYELIESIKFEFDYKTIEELLKKTNKLVLKNKPNNNYEIDYNKFGKYKDIVKEFVYIFSNTFSSEQTNYMLKRLNTLEIKNKPSKQNSFFSLKQSTGYYDSKNNTITIEIDEKKYIKHTLFHELLHMASTRQKNHHNYCGFNLHNELGIGLNEFYTEYLLEEYFYEESDYSNESIIIKEIEYLIGKEKLQNMYFNANLSDLISELSKCSNRKEIIRILYEYDGIYNYMYGNGMIYKIEKKLDRLIDKKEKEKAIKYVI